MERKKLGFISSDRLAKFGFIRTCANSPHYEPLVFCEKKSEDLEELLQTIIAAGLHILIIDYELVFGPENTEVFGTDIADELAGRDIDIRIRSLPKHQEKIEGRGHVFESLDGFAGI